MNTPALIASGAAILTIAAYIVFRFLFGASQVASLAALGRLPKLPTSWQQFLFDEYKDKSN